ncbi:MAG TPA: hypothetical protein VI636_04995 [Candidatus Angelobacter sp.]
MRNACTKWKDPLLEAALTENVNDELRHHLLQCADCAAELQALRARRQQMDALLPLVARAAEPSPNLGARIMAAAEAAGRGRRPNLWRVWALAGAGTAVVIAAILVFALNRQPSLTETELRQSQALAHWQAPTDVLLRFPGQGILNSTPKLGESYLTMPGVGLGQERPQGLKP